VINEIKASPVPIILFIDEAHTLIGAGGGAGQNDAANMLKPALARGELRTIAATTWAEYKRYFEKDAALARRFQVVKIEEPDEKKALIMMRAIAPFLEKHHKVMITDEALLDSVRLSRRYLPARQLPDKSVSVLDTACARVVAAIASRCTEVDSGASNIDHILTNTLLPEMSKELLSRMVNEEQVKEVRVTLDAEGQFLFAME
jgi:type VI secretion system protein VasG